MATEPKPTAGRGEPQLACEHATKQASRGSPLPADRLWYISRNLPHFDSATVIQAITYRLSDSLPRHVAKRLADELTPDAEPRHRRRIEASLDAGHGSCCLTDPTLARDIIDTWHRCADVRYQLHAWCVMPNHVHVLIAPLPEFALGSIVQSWKSWTGKNIKARTGTVMWQRDYWDRFIRDESHYQQTVAYIHENPVTAGLASSAEAWPWSSAARQERPRGEAGPGLPVQPTQLG